MAIPLWAVGRHLTLVQITPLVANQTTGALVPGTTVVITGLVDGLEPEEVVTHEEISPVTTTRENNVPLMYGTRMRVVEILTIQPSVINTRGPQLLLLKSTFLATSFALIQWTHGGNTNAYYGSYERMSAPWQGKGKKIVSASFLPIDNGLDNWVYS